MNFQVDEFLQAYHEPNYPLPLQYGHIYAPFYHGKIDRAALFARDRVGSYCKGN